MPSELPSEAPTSDTFSFSGSGNLGGLAVPSSSPSSAPTWTAAESICVMKPKIEDSSLELDGSGHPDDDAVPARVVAMSASTDEVKFAIDNVWQSSSSIIETIRVLYKSTSQGMVCSSFSNVESSTSDMTAECENGAAEVAIFVSDSSFTGVKDVSSLVPNACIDTDGDFTETNENMVMFVFSVPCDAENESWCVPGTMCPDSETPSATPTAVESGAPSESPSESPSEAPSNFPSEASYGSESINYLTEIPSAIPSSSPSSVPTWTAAESICIMEAKLEESSLEFNGPGHPDDEAVAARVVTMSANADEVKFAIDNVWQSSSSSIDKIRVVYESTSQGMVCSRFSNVVSSTPDMTVKCTNGVAEVATFVSDSSFTGVQDVSGLLPNACSKIIADGDISDWDLDASLLAPMYNSGNPDKSFSGYEEAGKAYSEYDCHSQTLCILVMANDGFVIDESIEDSWIKDYESGLTANKYPAKGGGIQFVENASGAIVGWEGCFDVSGVSTGMRNSIEIHANYGGNTLSTGKQGTKASLITVNLLCANQSNENMVMFVFKVPCDQDDTSWCAPGTMCPDSSTSGQIATGTAALVSSTGSSPGCTQEARLDSDSTEDGKAGRYHTNPIVISDQQGTSVTFQVEQTWDIPDGASLDSLEVYYETVGETMACVKSSSDPKPTFTAKCSNDVAEVALFVRDSSFEGLGDVSSTVPTTCTGALNPEDATTGDLVMFFFTIPCNPSDISFCKSGVVSLDGAANLQAQDDKDDEITITTNEIACGALHEETFETPGDALSWEGGFDSNTDIFGNFLGRFGSLNPQVQKVFHMPTGASSATISFKLYDINGGTSDDSLQLGFQNSWTDIDLNTAAEQYHQDDSVTLRDRNYDRVVFSVTPFDNVYVIEVDIPKRWWMNNDNKLPFGFRVNTSNDINEDSYGIDDFTVQVDCGSQRRAMDTIEDPPESEPSEEGEDGSYYCKASDYPCGEGRDMVHVCHYSTRLGYQTFCIPEEDSEVLRFYGNDYCGPCAGGFKGSMD